MPAGNLQTFLSYIALRFFLPKEGRRNVGVRYYATRILPCGFFMAAAFLTGMNGKVTGVDSELNGQDD